MRVVAAARNAAAEGARGARGSHARHAAGAHTGDESLAQAVELGQARAHLSAPLRNNFLQLQQAVFHQVGIPIGDGLRDVVDVISDLVANVVDILGELANAQGSIVVHAFSSPLGSSQPMCWLIPQTTLKQEHRSRAEAWPVS